MSSAFPKIGRGFGPGGSGSVPELLAVKYLSARNVTKKAIPKSAIGEVMSNIVIRISGYRTYSRVLFIPNIKTLSGCAGNEG